MTQAIDTPMAGVDAARMAPDTHRSELILMFDRKCILICFWSKMFENIAHIEIRTR